MSKKDFEEIEKFNFFSIFSTKNLFTTQSIVVMSLMAALSIVLSRFSIYITPTFKAISFSYLPGVIVAMLYGPWAAIVFGFVTDTLNFFTSSHGSAYFIGYAISEMVGYFIYALFLYKRPIKIWRFAVARLLIIIFVYLGLNFVWSSMMYGTIAGKYFSGVRLINHVVQFPFHVFITTFISKYTLKILSRSSINIPGQTIPIIDKKN